MKPVALKSPRFFPFLLCLAAVGAVAGVASVRPAGTPGDLESRPAGLADRVTAEWLGSRGKRDRESCFRIRLVSATYDHAFFPYWDAELDVAGRAIPLKPERQPRRPKSAPLEEDGSPSPRFASEVVACAILPADAVTVRLRLTPRFTADRAPVVMAWHQVPGERELSDTETAE